MARLWSGWVALMAVLALAGCGSAGSPVGSGAAASAPASSTSTGASTPESGSAAGVPGSAAASASAQAKPGSASGPPPARLTGGDPKGYPIRVSYPSPAVSALYYYAGLDQGFFAQQHLNVTMIQMAQSVIIPAESKGDIDFNDTMPVAIEGAIKGFPMRGVLATWSRAPWTVVGKADIKTLQDLKGRNFGTNQAGSSPYLYFEAALKRVGMKLTDLNVVSSPATQDTFLLLQAGKVDAAVLSPPFDAVAEGQGFHEIQPIGDALKLPFGGVGANQAFLSQHHAEAVAFLRAMLDSGQWLKGHPNEAASLIEKRIGVSHEVALRSAQVMAPLVTDSGEYPRDAVQAVLDSQAAIEHKTINMTPEQVVDYGPLHEALSRG